MATWLKVVMTPFLALLARGVQDKSFVGIELKQLGHFFPVREYPESHYTFLLECYAQDMDLPEAWSWDTRACDEFCRQNRLEHIIREERMLFTKGVFII